MVKFIHFVDGTMWDTLAEIDYQEHGVAYSEGEIGYYIPYTAILYIQTGIKTAAD